DKVRAHAKEVARKFLDRLRSEESLQHRSRPAGANQRHAWNGVVRERLSLNELTPQQTLHCSWRSPLCSDCADERAHARTAKSVNDDTGLVERLKNPNMGCSARAATRKYDAD